MTITLGQLIIWLIIGALVGTLVGRLVRDRRRGFGFSGNLLLGLVGAVVGGILFDVLNIDLGLGSLALTAEDLVAAFAGSLLVLLVLRFVRR